MSVHYANRHIGFDTDQSVGYYYYFFLVRLPAPEGFIHVTCSVTFRCPSICVPFPLQSEAIDCCIVADVAPRSEGGDGRAIYYRPRRTNHSMIDVVIISMTSIMMPLADMKVFFSPFFCLLFVCVIYSNRNRLFPSFVSIDGFRRCVSDGWFGRNRFPVKCRWWNAALGLQSAGQCRLSCLQQSSKVAMLPKLKRDVWRAIVPVLDSRRCRRTMRQVGWGGGEETTNTMLNSSTYFNWMDPFHDIGRFVMTWLESDLRGIGRWKRRGESGRLGGASGAPGPSSAPVRADWLPAQLPLKFPDWFLLNYSDFCLFHGGSGPGEGVGEGKGGKGWVWLMAKLIWKSRWAVDGKSWLW